MGKDGEGKVKEAGGRLFLLLLLLMLMTLYNIYTSVAFNNIVFTTTF